MVTIKRQGTGFKVRFSQAISLGANFTVQARDLAEVHQALEHYYGEGHRADPCPICRKYPEARR